MEVKTIQETCCTQGCGIMFWIAQEYQERLISTKQTFYCPNGHSMSYTGESEQAKISRLIMEKNKILRETSIEIERIKKECNKKSKKKNK